jgi:hypothetical protein
MQGRAASAFGCGRGYFEAEGHCFEYGTAALWLGA